MAGPRLLPKSIVQASLAQERKIEIDKGVKLVKAIEALRETKTEEEQKLERFRVETIAKVQIEIDSFIWERDRLKQELETLQANLQDYGRK